MLETNFSNVDYFDIRTYDNILDICETEFILDYQPEE